MSISDDNASTNHYVFHTSVSDFSLLLLDIIFNSKTYGEVDYRTLWENNINSMYLTKEGYMQARKLSKNLLKESFFKKLISDSKKLNDDLKLYKTPVLNEKNIVKHWDECLKLMNEFCRLYRFYEQPFQQALEELVLKYISEEELVEYASTLAVDVIGSIEINDDAKKAFDKLFALGKLKLELHENASSLLTTNLTRFIEFVARKNNLDIEIVQSLRLNKFTNLLKKKAVVNNADIRLAKERLKGCAIIKRNGKWFFDSGNKYLYWKNRIKKNDGEEIVGKVAYSGVVTGKVVLHLSWTDTTNINQGEILVTGMTNPQMVPFIKKAAAIITDEGGITCHAAIISRELKKPCITGTKNATQLLADGDLVEVDADKGVVKILKKAKK